jgi:hypothetical protein
LCYGCSLIGGETSALVGFQLLRRLPPDILCMGSEIKAGCTKDADNAECYTDQGKLNLPIVVRL